MADVRHLGQAGVYRIASELALRGISTYFPSVDLGVDLITHKGLRLQVKTAALRERKQGIGYFIGFGWNQAGTERRARRRPRKYSEEVDLVVIWGVDENRFWIAPSKLFDDHSGLLLRPGKELPPAILNGFCREVAEHENRWDLILG